MQQKGEQDIIPKNNFLGLKQGKQLNIKTIGYCRVSLHKQKDDLERQVENVNIYICLRI